MTYTNEVRRLIVEGGDWPALVARLWLVGRRLGLPRDQSPYEDATPSGGSTATFTLVNGPSLLGQTGGRQCGLSIHEVGEPGVTGPLFRFGDVDTLPTPAPADPEGYVDVVELASMDQPVAPRNPWGPPFSTLPITFPWGVVTSIGAVVPTAGALDLVVSGTTPPAAGSTPWSYLHRLALAPSWALDLPSPMFEQTRAGGSSTGPVPSEAVAWTGSVVELAYLNAFHQDVVAAAIVAWAGLLVPPVKPSLMPGTTAPGVVLSARRLHLVPPGFLRLSVVAGAFGSASDRQFPPNLRDTAGPRGCALGGARLVGALALASVTSGARPARRPPGRT